MRSDGLMELPAVQLENVRRSDHKHHARTRRQKLAYTGERAALDNSVIGSLRRFHAKAGHIRSLYHGPVASTENSLVFPAVAVGGSSGGGASFHPAVGGTGDPFVRDRHS